MRRKEDQRQRDGRVSGRRLEVGMDLSLPTDLRGRQVSKHKRKAGVFCFIGGCPATPKSGVRGRRKRGETGCRRSKD